MNEVYLLNPVKLIFIRKKIFKFLSKNVNNFFSLLAAFLFSHCLYPNKKHDPPALRLITRPDHFYIKTLIFQLFKCNSKLVFWWLILELFQKIFSGKESEKGSLRSQRFNCSETHSRITKKDSRITKKRLDHNKKKDSSMCASKSKQEWDGTGFDDSTYFDMNSFINSQLLFLY